MRFGGPCPVVVKHNPIVKESTRQRGNPKGSALIPDSSDLDGSELQRLGCVVDYARGGGSSGGVVTESGATATSDATRSGADPPRLRAAADEASAAGAHGTID
jgi:hypothetical protein